MWLFFENLLRPPIEANFSFHWLFAPRFAVWKQIHGLWQLQFSDSIGHAWGCPRLPGHPNLTYMGLYDLCEGAHYEKFTNGDFCKKKLCQSSQFGDFWGSVISPRKMSIFFTRKPSNKSKSLKYVRFGCPGSLGHLPGIPDRVRQKCIWGPWFCF